MHRFISNSFFKTVIRAEYDVSVLNVRMYIGTLHVSGYYLDLKDKRDNFQVVHLRKYSTYQNLCNI